MKVLISVSAEEYAKGDRVAYKAKKDEWYAGTVSSVRAGLVGILFDDGVKASPSKPSSRTWRRLKGTRKYVKPMTDAQVEAATLATGGAKAKPAPIKALPVVKKAAKGGAVVRSKYGDIVILSKKYGRKHAEYKWSTRR